MRQLDQAQGAAMGLDGSDNDDLIRVPESNHRQRFPAVGRLVTGRGLALLIGDVCRMGALARRFQPTQRGDARSGSGWLSSLPGRSNLLSAEGPYRAGTGISFIRRYMVSCPRW